MGYLEGLKLFHCLFQFVSDNHYKHLCTYTNMVMNKMQRTKIAIALVAVAALTLVAVGLASAQMIADQPYTTTNPNQAAPNNGFWGWLGNCFGYGTNQAYAGQYAVPQAPTDGTAPTPYQLYRGSYGYSYGMATDPVGQDKRNHYLTA